MYATSFEKSHPTMGAWIEIVICRYIYNCTMSHPTMGAWIEIKVLSIMTQLFFVAPHDGCVD